MAVRKFNINFSKSCSCAFLIRTATFKNEREFAHSRYLAAHWRVAIEQLLAPPAPPPGGSGGIGLGGIWDQTRERTPPSRATQML